MIVNIKLDQPYQEGDIVETRLWDLNLKPTKQTGKAEIIHGPIPCSTVDQEIYKSKWRYDAMLLDKIILSNGEVYGIGKAVTIYQFNIRRKVN